MKKGSTVSSPRAMSWPRPQRQATVLGCQRVNASYSQESHFLGNRGLPRAGPQLDVGSGGECSSLTAWCPRALGWLRTYPFEVILVLPAGWGLGAGLGRQRSPLIFRGTCYQAEVGGRDSRQGPSWMRGSWEVWRVFFLCPWEFCITHSYLFILFTVEGLLCTGLVLGAGHNSCCYEGIFQGWEEKEEMNE
jgi:hypothetical protein